MSVLYIQKSNIFSEFKNKFWIFSAFYLHLINIPICACFKIIKIFPKLWNFFFPVFLFAVSRLLLQSEECDVLRISSVRSEIFRICFKTSETSKIRLSCFRRRTVDPACGRGLRVSDVATSVFQIILEL